MIDRSTTILSLVISIPIFKMKGVYFTIGTWIVAEAIAIFFTNWAFVNYAEGFTLSITYKISYELLYWIALILGIGSIVLIYALLRSKLGLALMAIRDNEKAAEVRGIKVFKTKLMCFLIASVFTGVTGVVIFIMDPYVKPFNAFGISWAISMVFIVVIGGIGTIEGPIVGAIIYIVLRQWLYKFPGISMIILGAIAVAVIMLLPKGVFGTLHERYGIELFSVRRHIQRSTDPDLKLRDIL
jgi:branched-chain amino acid transport system permease protein